MAGCIPTWSRHWLAAMSVRLVDLGIVQAGGEAHEEVHTMVTQSPGQHIHTNTFQSFCRGRAFASRGKTCWKELWSGSSQLDLSLLDELETSKV